MFQLIVFIFIQSTFIYCESPIIETVTKVGLQRVQIYWGHCCGVNPAAVYTRYYIQVIDSENVIKDWPSQAVDGSCNSMMIVNKNIENIGSNFECKTECINDPSCFGYEIIRNQNMLNYTCNLQSNENYPFIMTTGPFLSKSNKICGTVKAYDNSALVDSLPYPNIYRFRVKVYDVNIAKWSEYSEWSQNISISLNINIDVQRTSDKELVIKWVELYGYPISRFKVIVLKNDISYTENTNIADNANEILTNYHESYENYDTLSDNLEGTREDNETQCYYQCLKKKLNSVRGVFYKQNLGSSITESTCFCKSSLDISNGILKNEESTVFFINSLARNYTLQNLELNCEYKIMLECSVPFSNSSIIKSVIYKLTNFKPILNVTTDIFNLTRTLKWNLEEKIEISRIHVTLQEVEYEQEVTYYKNNNYDYESTGSNDAIYLQYTFENCYETCFQNKNCFAISHNSGSVCRIITNKNAVKKPCDSGTICTEIFEGNIEVLKLESFKINTNQCYRIKIKTFNGIDGEKSEPFCVKSSLDNRILKLDEFKIGNSGRLLCYHSLINDNFVKKITWKLNNEDINENQTNTEIMDNDKILYFKNFGKSNFGSYSCEINIDDSKISLKSNVLELNDSKSDSQLIIISSALSAIILVLLIVLIIFAILFFKIKKKPKNMKDDWFTNKTNTSLTEIERVDPDRCSTQQQERIRTSNHYATRPQQLPPVPTKKAPAAPGKKKSTRKYKSEQQGKYDDANLEENEYAN